MRMDVLVPVPVLVVHMSGFPIAIFWQDFIKAAL